MIEIIDARLRDWLTTVADGNDISFALPSNDASKLTLSVYLFDIDRPAAVPSGRTPPLQLRLGYLISACGPDPIAAHALLGKIVAEAGTQSQYSLEFGAPAAAAWTALHLSARASFILRATASADIGGVVAKPVRTTVLSSLPIEALSGTVTASDGTPLSGATVAIPELGRTTTAGADGTFMLEGVTSAVDLTLHARAKGREAIVKRAAHSTGDVNVVVDLAGGTTPTPK